MRSVPSIFSFMSKCTLSRLTAEAMHLANIECVMYILYVSELTNLERTAIVNRLKQSVV